MLRGRRYKDAEAQENWRCKCIQALPPPTELAKKISNSLGDLGERATEVPDYALSPHCSDRSESVYLRAKPSCHCARKLS